VLDLAVQLAQSWVGLQDVGVADARYHLDIETDTCSTSFRTSRRGSLNGLQRSAEDLVVTRECRVPPERRHHKPSPEGTLPGPPEPTLLTW
jgi:hypothetical protein